MTRPVAGFRLVAHVLSLFAVIAVLMLAEMASAQTRTVVSTGEIAPDKTGAVDDNLTFGALTRPTLNNNGEVAFTGEVNDDNFTAGIYSEGDGVGLLRNVVSVGDAAPGTSSTFDDFATFTNGFFLNDLGDVAFRAHFDGFNMEGLWTDRDRPGTAVSAIAVAGDTAPGTTDPARVYSLFQFSAFNNSSEAAFKSTMPPTAGPGNFPSEGVFSEGGGLILDKVAEVGDFAPDTFRPSTGLEALFAPDSPSPAFAAPVINNSGHVAFKAETNAGASVNSIGDAGVWTNGPDFNLTSVALHGQIAPDSDLDGGGDREFSVLFRSGVSMNDDGDVAFAATLTGLIAGNLREGIWVQRDGGVEKVAIEYEFAPGTTDRFDDISSPPIIDEAGYVTFTAETNATEDGLWSEGASGLQKIALQGESAPGTGLNYENILNFAVNSAGHAAFLTQLSDTSTDAIFAQDATGRLRKIVADGETVAVDVNGSTLLAEVEDIEFLGQLGPNDPVGASGWNDAYQVAYKIFYFFDDGNISFDGESILVSDLATVPLGDMNGDGNVTIADSPLLIQALVDRAAYDAHAFTTPTINGLLIDADFVGDVNEDGVFDLGDVAAFNALFAGPATAAGVPEPGAGLLAILAMVALMCSRRESVGKLRCLEPHA